MALLQFGLENLGTARSWAIGACIVSGINIGMLVTVMRHIDVRFDRIEKKLSRILKEDD